MFGVWIKKGGLALSDFATIVAKEESYDKSDSKIERISQWPNHIRILPRITLIASLNVIVLSA